MRFFSMCPMRRLFTDKLEQAAGKQFAETNAMEKQEGKKSIERALMPKM